MALPRTLMTAPLADLDLEVLAGAVPDDCGGEVYLSAPVVDPALDYQLFGFGAMVRLSLQPGTHGAAPERFALRHRVIDTPTKRLHDIAPDAFSTGPLGFETNALAGGGQVGGPPATRATHHPGHHPRQAPLHRVAWKDT